MASPDIVVVGGGFAGLAAAAALSETGANVTVLEALDGPISTFRGELIHPRGVRLLGLLGLCQVLRDAGSTTVAGFAAFAPHEPDPVVLPYAHSGGLGMGVEHRAMVMGFRQTLARRKKVRIATRQRVERLLAQRGRVVGVVCADGSEYRADLVVAADGRHSKLRKLLEIPTEVKLVSYTIALAIEGDLPNPGHGHVFLGAPGPILAYSYKSGGVRMCIDVPRDAARGQGAMFGYARAHHAPHVPEPLRTAMLEAMDRGRLEACANHEVTTESSVSPGLVLVGDAGGCSHPLTATGLTSALHDVTKLATAISLHGVSDEATFAYQKSRYRFVRARELLTHALYDVFRGEDTRGRVLREGLFRYWRGSARARAVSMGILSGEQTTKAKFVLEYARVLAGVPHIIASRSLHRIQHASL